ncbi:MAG: hypothetical protein JWQ11_4926, partial [Rhizobacter sp.]|nr:hypothetical protein [Rhizobacter sp.]
VHPLTDDAVMARALDDAVSASF